MKGTVSITLAFLACISLASTNALAAPPAKSAAKRPAAKPAPARRAGGPAAVGGGGASNASFNSYADQMRNKMGSKWDYPTGNNSVTLTVKVSQDGSVSDLSLSSSPKNTEAEQKANDAFNSAQPLQALPSGTSAAVITCIFNSQADQWNSKANISVKLDPQKSAEAPASNPGAAGSDAPAGEEKKD